MRGKIADMSNLIIIFRGTGVSLYVSQHTAPLCLTILGFIRYMNPIVIKADSASLIDTISCLFYMNLWYTRYNGSLGGVKFKECLTL